MNLGDKYLKLYHDKECSKPFVNYENLEMPSSVDEMYLEEGKTNRFILYLKNLSEKITFQNIKFSCADPVATFEPLGDSLAPLEITEVLYCLNAKAIMEREYNLSALITIEFTAVLPYKQ
jgi:hypothetical protein